MYKILIIFIQNLFKTNEESFTGKNIFKTN